MHSVCVLFIHIIDSIITTTNHWWWWLNNTNKKRESLMMQGIGILIIYYSTV